MGKIKQAFLLTLNMMLVIFMICSNFEDVVSAKEENYSIRSPETFTYATNLDEHERRQLFNDNWKFHYGEQSNAQSRAFDDSNWEDVQLPHDYSLDLPYTKSGEAESGYKLGGIGWYRKSFTLEESMADKRVMIEFGGVYNHTKVYINGHELGDHPNGYTPFAYDLTDYIDYEGENVIAVRVNHKFPSSRWYSGSGIYRNVYLTITEDVYVDHYGVQVLTPNLEEQAGGDVDVEINANINNDSKEDVEAVVKQSIRKKDSENMITSNESEPLTIPGEDSITSTVSLQVNDPILWSTEHPYLYEIVTEVIVDDEVVDEYVTDYGFRTFNFDAETGFSLNGEPMKLKGVSMHHDQGPLGAAAHYRAMERQVDILLEMGINAIRVTHNPAADELLEIANRKGVLIIDEAFDTWVDSKNGNYHDYAVWFNEVIGEDNELLGAESNMTWAEFDIKTMVRRGINDPSIISWSVGNEVMEGNSGPYDEYPDILEQLTKWVLEVDKTRPATIGDNKLKANWQEAVDFGERLTEYDGIVGFNYADGSHLDNFHERFPDWKIYGAETASSINSRGVYNPDNYDRHLTSYDESTVGWGKLSADSWYTTITRDFVAGEFVWTGFDYLGEPTPWNNVGPGATGEWPSPKSSYFGIVDTAGIPKDRYYFYQSQWNDDVDTLHVLPAWKEDVVEIDDDGKVRVDVYSNAHSVELFFENEEGEETSLGKKTFTEHTTDAGYSYKLYEGNDKSSEEFRNLYLTWNVPYEDGTVYAVAYDENGEVISETEGRDYVQTFKKASNLELNADRSTIKADGRDLSYVTIDIVDEDGHLVEDASNLLHVNVSGEGELLALDNGDQLDHEPYDSGKRQAFNGKLVAVVQSTNVPGEITLEVEGEGIESESISLTTTPTSDSTDDDEVIGYTMPKNYYVKSGHEPDLVSEATVLLSDGSEKTAPITWDIDDEVFDKESGEVRVVGHIEDYDLPVVAYVTIIDSVGALLNYSVATETGIDEVNLPSTRPIVLENGDVLAAEFPVDWEEQHKEDYEKPGHVMIEGTAEVFDETIPVTASVRVSDAEVSLGENVASNYLTLTQSIPEEYQSGNLQAIVNGDTGLASVSQADEFDENIWTNYKMAQTGQREAEIIFTYATAQYLGSVDLFFYEDHSTFTLPENVELYWSNEGTEDANWTKIDNVTEIINEEIDENSNIVPIHYRFSGVPAVAFKIVITSEDGVNDDDENLAVGLTEAELRVEERSFDEYSEATLDDILLNGESVSAYELENKIINTEYQKVDVETKSDKNVAVTILEPHDDVVYVVTESEDHSKRETYTIYLDQPAPDKDLPADDGLRDYPYEKTKATAGAYHENHDTEGDPNFAIDNDPDTIFHTPWEGTDPENFWITLELEEATELDALRYLSRDGNTNGIVKEYEIMCSLDHESWEKVAEGEWSDEQNHWSIAEFAEPHECKFVRLQALSTYGDWGEEDTYMSASEIRLRTALVKESITDAKVNLEEEIFEYDGNPKKPEVEVILDSEELEEGIDYRVKYDDNVEAGEAKVIIQGIAKYEDIIEKTFTIIDKTLLEILLERAENEDLDKYTDETKKTLQRAIKQAKDTIKNATTQKEIDDAFLNLENALEHLEEKDPLDKTILDEKLNEAKNVDPDIYTESSIEALQDAIDQGQDIYETATTQAEIDHAIDILNDALNNLEEKEEIEDITKEELKEILEKAKHIDTNKYTEETVETLQNAIEIGTAALEYATNQEQVEEAIEQLHKAIDNLKEKEKAVDQSDLEEAITKAKNKDKEKYTIDSWKSLQNALQNAKQVLNDDAATQEEVDQVLDQLNDALDRLEKIDSTDQKGVDNDNKLPKTATPIFNYFLIGILMSCLGGYVLWRNYNKHKING